VGLICPAAQKGSFLQEQALWIASAGAEVWIAATRGTSIDDNPQMHKWDRHLQAPRDASPPIRWQSASSLREQRELRSRNYRRSSQGLYVPAYIEVTAAQRIVEAHALIEDGGAVGGWGAAHWQGAPFNDGLMPGGQVRPVLVCIGSRRIQRRAGIEISRDRLPAVDLVEIRGVTCTGPLRTAFDLARRARSLTGAVISLDTLIECGLIDVSSLRAFIDAHPGWRGVPQARRAADLSVSGVRSPQETRLRLIWQLDAGLPPLLVNAPIFSQHGHLLGIADCLDEKSGTVLEYDGEDHEEDAHNKSDRVRDEVFAAHGLIVERVTRHDVSAARDALTERLRATYRRALEWRREKQWTLAPPDGWTAPGS
jgi:hypothetical protein